MLSFDDEEKKEPVEEENTEHRRVKVDDKRVINCQSDVNQLMPLKYKWAWEKYLDGCSNHWMPQEVNMSRDIALWKDPNGLTDDERLIVKRNLGFFVTADSLAANNIVLGTYRHITNPECRQYLLRQAFEECQIEGTEVLTPDGWVDFRDIDLNSTIAQFNNGQVEFVKPSHLTKNYVDGKMYRFANGNNSMEQIVTPGHRMVYFDEYKNEYGVEEAKTIKYTKKRMVVSGIKNTGEFTQLTPHERFLIALQADGSLLDTCSRTKPGTVTTSFWFIKPCKIDRLRGIIQQCGYCSTESKPDHRGRINIRVFVPMDKYLSKVFDWVDLESVSGSWAEEFIQEIAYWDGHINPYNGITYCSKYVINTDVVQSLCTISGRMASYGLREDGRSESFSDIHILYITERDCLSSGTVTKEEIDYQGMVYCATVPSGMLVVRYNKKVSISGNCIHCYIDGTMILTEDGFIDFKMLTKDTKVAQYHDDGSITFIVPDEILHDRYTGTMYRFHNKSNTYESIVTPQHRCVVLDSNNKPTIVLAENLNIKKHEVPVTGFAYGKKKALEDIERFRIAYQMEKEADNIVVVDNGAGRTNIHMYFAEEDKVTRIRSICNALEWTVVTKPVSDEKNGLYGYTLCDIELPSSITLYETFRWISISKLDRTWCLDFMNELQYWGKYIKFPEGDWVTSTNLETCNKIKTIALLCGKVARTYKQKDNTIEDRGYNLHISNSTRVSGADITKSSIYYDGLVHCVGVPTGMIITKYNDCVTVSGNTHAYQYISESIGLDEGEIFNAYKEVKSIREKDEFLIPFIDTLTDPMFKTGTFEADQQLLKSIIMFACVMEGLFFYVGFVQILALGRQNKMTGAAEQYALILKDETNHCNFGIDLINQIKIENPRLWTEEFKEEIKSLMLKGLELEYRYAEDTMPRGVLGLNAPKCSYVQRVSKIHLK